MAAICAGNVVAAQSSLEQSLATLSVFDCTDGETRTIFLFESTSEGAVKLLTRQEAPTKMGDDGFATTPARAIKGTFVFRDGTATKGECTSVTHTARATYPAITAGLLPDLDADTSAENIAATLTIHDLQARLAEAESVSAALDATLSRIQAYLASTSADRDAALARKAAMQQELAATIVQLDMIEQDRRKMVANVATLTQSVAALRQSLREADESAEKARADADAMGNLADAAITWISTLQVRSAVAVRGEMCGTISSNARPAICP